MTASTELLDFVNKLHDQSLELLRDVKFDKRPEQDGYLVCCYASMIELFGGVLVLIKEGNKTAVSPVFRTLLETYVNFKNVLADTAYVSHAFARHHADWVEVLESHERPNRFLEGIHTHQDRDKALALHKQRLDHLREQGIRPLSVRQRFERAGMNEEYLSIYHFESDKIHSSWQALISRHFETAVDDFGLTIYKARSLEDYIVYLDSSAVVLLDATKEVHKRFGTNDKAAIEVLDRQFAEIRARY